MRSKCVPPGPRSWEIGAARAEGAGGASLSVAATSSPQQPWLNWGTPTSSLPLSSPRGPPLTKQLLAPPPPCAERLLHQYREAMEMERDFFAAQPGLAKPRALGLLVIDFDETITEADTTAKIARAAIMANVAKASGVLEGVLSRMLLPWFGRWGVGEGEARVAGAGEVALSPSQGHPGSRDAACTAPRPRKPQPRCRRLWE